MLIISAFRVFRCSNSSFVYLAPSKENYFTMPFSRYSARLVRTLAAAPSAATLAISCSTISFTSSSNVVLDGFHPSFAFALVGSP